MDIIKIMKILLAGDSFAADWTVKYPNQKGWPNLLAKKFNIKNVAQAGCSEYKIYKQLEKEVLEKYDYIIICHTSPFRIPTINHPIHFNDILHKNCDLLYSDIKENLDKNPELISICNFFEKYFDFESAIFDHTLICKEIELITSSYNTIHIVNIDWTELYQFKNVLDFNKLFQKNKGIMNHYNDIGNEIIYKIILEKLTA
jgi:hypothetical protein